MYTLKTLTSSSPAPTSSEPGIERQPAGLSTRKPVGDEEPCAAADDDIDGQCGEAADLVVAADPTDDPGGAEIDEECDAEQADARGGDADAASRAVPSERVHDRHGAVELR